MDLPPGWVYIWDNTENRPYFVDPNGNSQWEIPTEYAVPTTPPVGWSRLWDVDTKKHYYMDNLGRSQWEFPTARATSIHLPYGWTETWDSNHNRFFYTDPNGISQWQFPGIPPPRLDSVSTLDHVKQLIQAHQQALVEAQQNLIQENIQREYVCATAVARFFPVYTGNPPTFVGRELERVNTDLLRYFNQYRNSEINPYRYKTLQGFLAYIVKTVLDSVVVVTQRDIETITPILQKLSFALFGTQRGAYGDPPDYSFFGDYISEHIHTYDLEYWNQIPEPEEGGSRKIKKSKKHNKRKSRTNFNKNKKKNVTKKHKYK